MQNGLGIFFALGMSLQLPKTSENHILYFFIDFVQP